MPKYYNPEIIRSLNKLKKSHELLVLGDLVDQGILTLSTGHEVGKLAYGTGSIPFIRTSEIANWEIKLDPKHGLSENIYNELKNKQDVRENDILMVRDGTYLVGTCGLVTKYDIKIVYQSHLYKIRSNDPEKIHPYLLLAVLTCPLDKAQVYSNAKEDIIKNVKDVMQYKELTREITKKTILGITPVSNEIDNNDFLTMSN